MSSAGRRIAIHGTVQGVGFRPWVYRLAHEEGVVGTVRNDPEGVTIDAFGSETSIERFLARLSGAPPPAAAIEDLIAEPLEEPVDPSLLRQFTIAPSATGHKPEYSIPPDLATCDECLEEVLDPDDRRFLYPFTNCTNCGPRFTITLDLPYDRPATTMAGFEMCPECRREYEDPLDRRFHAQPNACPRCGPRLELLAASGARVSLGGEALLAAGLAILDRRIVAVKGLGGFHLMVLASDERAVARLRRRKQRWEKPLAIMVRDLEQARAICEVSDAEARLLTSTEAPIVLLARRETSRDGASRVAPAVAPDNPRLGLMLPSTPLHHLLLRLVRQPVVATSGNLSDEPICIGNAEAIERLDGIADLFLVHDRPIARHADDSVIQVFDGHEQPLRRARGYAPRAIRMPDKAPPLLAVGAHLKNAIGVSDGDRTVLSQHIGDMETPQARTAFEAAIEDLLRMLETDPEAVAHDLHPDYPSTAWARSAVRSASGRFAGLPTVAVQHHHAHLAACLADNGVTGPALGVVFDGTGYGTDGTVWGGELLLGDARAFERVARLRPFRLPGGEMAVREPRRSALAVLVDTFGPEAAERGELAPLAGLEEHRRCQLLRLLAIGLGSPLTSSAGRLFDAVASLLDLRHRVSFEGQAAMAVEFAAVGTERGAYPLYLAGRGDETPAIELDWRPTIAAMVADLRNGVATGVIAARFHNALIEAVGALAEHVGCRVVALSGGCFQNEMLLTRLRRRLETAGLEVLVHRRVPTNDGGIALGQLAVAAAQTGTRRS